MPRTLAIGDVHGCSAALEALLGAIDPEPDDQVVLLGDYVNRGPDSRGVLDLILELRGRCRLVTLLGNHDQTLLDVLQGRQPDDQLIAMGGLTTLASYGLEGKPLRPRALPPSHIAFLEACVDFHETHDHIFVHASYMPFLPMFGQAPHVLRWRSIRDDPPGPHQSSKRVISGHTSQKTGEVLDLGYLTCIDTYCYGGGWLTALEVYSGQLWQVSREGKLRASPPRLLPWET